MALSGKEPANNDRLDNFVSESTAPLEQLQNLLLPPELLKSIYLIKQFEDKLAEIERNSRDTTELLVQLQPMIDELVNSRVTELIQSVSNSIIPIIDEVIQNKTKENKMSMGAAIAPAIPVAISHQMNDFPAEIAHAIAPEIAVAIKEQIRLERDAMVDALYPIIGSTIATYLAVEIRAINEKMENALSVEGIVRKIRAKVQGVSEAELIIKEARAFSVSAVFLIHKSSGLIISEVQSSSDRLESEMVAGMLTAIRSFVNDCIARSGDVSEIDAINYGTSQIILEVAGYCYLAVVIQGEPPQWFIRKLRQTLIIIVENYGKNIELFDGDSTTISAQVNPFLEELTNTSSKKVKAAKPPTLLIVSLIILSLIFIPLGIHWYSDRCDRNIETNTAIALASAPELSVYRLTVDANRETLKLSGRVPNQYLRLKAEQIAKAAAPTLKLDNKIIAVQIPPDPILTAGEVKRVTYILNQMNGTNLSSVVTSGKVTIEGIVTSVANAKKVTKAYEQIPGVQTVTNTVKIQSRTAGWAKPAKKK